jgi:hypothetical protein
MLMRMCVCVCVFVGSPSAVITHDECFRIK